MDTAAVYRQFGELVRKHRQRLHFTQDRLGEHVGLTRTSITNIERGHQKVLLHQFLLLAQALQISPEALLPPIEVAEVTPQIERKLEKYLTGAEKEWARRIVASGSKGGAPYATSKD